MSLIDTHIFMSNVPYDNVRLRHDTIRIDEWIMDLREKYGMRNVILSTAYDVNGNVIPGMKSVWVDKNAWKKYKDGTS